VTEQAAEQAAEQVPPKLFEAGLWTAFHVRNDLIIHVGIGRFEESSPHGRFLALFHKKPLHFHKDARLRPDPKHFEWHRKMHGF
jgi:hypothetical protein